MLSAFRKVSAAFSLAHCDYPFMVSISTALLRTVSLNVDPRHDKKIPIIFPILNIIVASAYFYIYVFSMVWFVFWRCFESGDILIGLIVFSLGVASEIGPLKLLFMFIYKNEMRNLVTQCLASDALLNPGTRLSTNLLKTLRVVKMRAVVFWSIIISNGIVYYTKPLLLPGRHLVEDFFVFYGLEPMFESPNFEIAYALNSLGIFTTVYLASNTAMFQILSAGYIEAQMLAWSEELLHLWEDATEHAKQNTVSNNDDSEVINEFVSERLKIIIKSHAMTINLHIMMENIFRTAIVVEFLVLFVSLVAELLGGLENTYLEVPFAMMQVGMDCFIGQRLMDASLVFSEAVYNCKWENFDSGNMKTVMTMMIISNKTMCLSAGSVMKLDFVSFLGIVKSIFSMYTTLRATMH